MINTLLQILVGRAPSKKAAKAAKVAIDTVHRELEKLDLAVLQNRAAEKLNGLHGPRTNGHHYD